MTTPVRAQAALTLNSVIQQQLSLASLMTPALQQVDTDDRALLQELCFGCCRWQPQLQAILNRLMEKPLKHKDGDIHSLLLIGLYQLIHTRIADHAAIHLTVEACAALKKPWAQKLVNGVLRSFQRLREELAQALATSPAYTSAHPNWLRKAIDGFWPDKADDIFAANNRYPPFTLRLNLARTERGDYLNSLQAQGFSAEATEFSPYGITLTQASDVHTIPGFDQGIVSVQDEAAQLSADLLAPQPGETVLDACCAPGGKTGHLLEIQPKLSRLVALDLEQRRLERVKDNLQRLGLTAEIVCHDAQQIQDWWDGELFDRILLDAPCSATGVIRRHPDIKLLRKATDIAKLASLQLSLLKALWTTLRPGGRLVYATCSILPTENTQVIEAFVEQQPDAIHRPIDAPWGLAQKYGRQLLPQQQGHDGFYYACLEKTR